MFSVSEGRAIYLRPGSTDMRKSINGLAALVQNELKKNPFEGGYFLFCGKTRKILKVLYWDETGFALWYKRLEEARFPWPAKEEEAKLITVEQVAWLLRGIDFFKAHKKLAYFCV